LKTAPVCLAVIAGKPHALFVDVAVVMATVAMVMVSNRKPTLTVLEAIFKK
jgi:hypothetical protein